MGSDDRLGEIVKRDYAKKYPVVHHGNIAAVVIQHEALKGVGVSVGGDRNRRGFHNCAYWRGPNSSVIAIDMTDNFAKRQHAGKFALLHDHERTDVVDTHGFECLYDLGFWRCGV